MHLFEAFEAFRSSSDCVDLICSLCEFRSRVAYTFVEEITLLKTRVNGATPAAAAADPTE